MDYTSYFDLFYREYKKQILQNHIFSCAIDEMTDKQLIVNFRLSNRACDEKVPFNCIKRNFHGRNNYPTASEAIQCRPQIMRSISVKQIVGSGMNPYKLVEMNTKFRPNIPPEYKNDILYNSAKEEQK